MTTLYSGGLRPFPGIAAQWTPRQKAHAHRILVDVHDATGAGVIEHVPGADIEDFWEDACRLSAAWRASGGDLTLVSDKSVWTPDEMRARLGPVTTAEEGGHHARDDQLVHPVLLRHGGLARAMTLLTISPDHVQVAAGATDLVEWMASRARAGVSMVVVKNAERKNGIWPLPVSVELSANRRAVQDHLDWTSVRLEGVRDGLLGQDLIDMRWEYRCFVVDGKVVTAAGCVEEHTPVDHDLGAGAFQTALREHRGHLARTASPVEDRPDIAARLLEFARRVAAEHGGTVVIDVALDHARDTPVVVELNGLPNSGLYASDPWALAQALMRAADRGYLSR